MTDDEAPGVKILEPANGATVAHDFTVKVDARDDCQLAKVSISVTPQALNAESKAPPFQWDLTNISGQQTITVTAVDGKGHTSTTTVNVAAPMSTGGTEDPAAASAGCTVASGAFSLAGLLPSLAMLLLFPRRRRFAPARPRRHVTGELEGTPEAAPAPATPEAVAQDDASAVTGAAAQVPLGGQ
jgi:hypothetical protein